ncbi:MAG: PIN domain-containing protein [Candidatus Micrarchaeia archaeon]|jgi:predicted nucleic acid-binding protein
MNSRYIIDTYAWIAYFNKKKFQKIIENEIVETPTIVVAELARTLFRKKIDQKQIDQLLNFVSKRGLILPLDIELAKKTGQICEKEHLSLVDGIIYSYIDSNNCYLVTGDEHFKNKKNVYFEKE